jgi:cell surface protein SprA
MVDIDLSIFTRLKKARNKARSIGTGSYSMLYSDYDPDRPNNKVSIMGNPSLGEVKTMMIGVRNLSGTIKSGEVWVNELRLMDVVSSGGWAASGALNMQLSDVATVNLTGKIITEGFGGLEDGVAARSKDNYKTYSLTTNVELGKFFPDKMKVTAPLYYSVTKEETRPKYNPLDTDMELDDALDAMTSHERDSIESIAVTRTTNTNFSLSNVRFGIKTKRHPMPYDPANFSFSYSHAHRYTSGETTVYEREDQWRGSLNYSYSPVYKPWEPFAKSKSKSKWMALPKSFGVNWLPQNISFNTEMTRVYHELQERNMEDLGGSRLPITFNSQFLWNRSFSLRWDFTRNLHMNFQSGTQAEIEQPLSNLPVNKELYPDHYEAWKDSVWQSIKHFGRPLDYRQTFTASYQLPLNKLPIFDWVTSDATYNATYNWVRGTELNDGTNLGNTISNNRQLNINGNFNMETLYNHFPFLKKVNDRFRKPITKAPKKPKEVKDPKTSRTRGKTDDNAAKNKAEASLPKNKNSFQKELSLLPDSSFIVTHNKKTKRLIVTARTKDGHSYPIKYKVVDQNKIKIKGVDSVDVKLTVTAKPPLENAWWYKPAQSAARLLMMVRSIGISYRNQYSMSLPGFKPNIGDAFGQRTGGVMAPGLDFAFGVVGDSYLQKAVDNNWLVMADSIATPASTNQTTDLQVRATLEPIRDLKIDLNAARTESRSRRIQYMYHGMPTTQSGTFNMTTISISSAFEGMGDANSGYPSAVFQRFCDALPRFQQMAAEHYGVADVKQYSAAVMIPAFLDTYTSSGRGSLDFMPSLWKLLPNWTIRYSGLSKLRWFSDHFKSVNLNHSYKSVFALGSYTSSTETASLLGWNVPTVSINESFSPLIGADVTFLNNLTLKAEYRRTRVLNLSMTSVQINESRSNDIVIGVGYKVSDFRLFGSGATRKIRKAQSGKNSRTSQTTQTSSTSNRKSCINHDLNLRLDISLRDQAAITRDIATRTSAASSGNSAFKMSFMADYTLSRLMTLSAYYDRQTNTPLLSSSSYPTTTHDFGLSLKFSLTR